VLPASSSMSRPVASPRAVAFTSCSATGPANSALLNRSVVSVANSCSASAVGCMTAR
jgi:hypothetical protein